MPIGILTSGPRALGSVERLNFETNSYRKLTKVHVFKKISYLQKFLKTFFFGQRPLFPILPSSAEGGGTLYKPKFVHTILFMITVFTPFYSHLILYNHYLPQPRGAKLSCQHGWGAWPDKSPGSATGYTAATTKPKPVYH